MPAVEGTDGRFRSPLIEPDLPISVIRLSDGIRSRYSRAGAGKSGQGQYAKFAEDVLPWIASGTSVANFAATHEKAADTGIDKAIEFGTHGEH